MIQRKLHVYIRAKSKTDLDISSERVRAQRTDHFICRPDQPRCCSMTWTQSCEQADEIMDVSEITTPIKKLSSPPKVMDEDSGLGMDYDDLLKDDETDTFAWNASEIDSHSSIMLRPFVEQKTSLTHKRSHENVNSYSVAKRQRRNENDFTKKSLSFMDKPYFMRDQSNICEVVDKFVDGDDVIGNGSGSYCLPTIPGKHSDLKSITSQTMTDVLLGRYDDVINSYRIIDCRYPYEYDGGHIKGAENFHTNEQILELLCSARQTNGKRNILIFHCEFSSERGPKRSRFLRNKDRECNKDRYPFLHFPEVYLLHDGYKAFYESFKEFCEPMSYTPMNHASHLADLRHFRSKSKTWCGNERKRHTPLRLMF